MKELIDQSKVRELILDHLKSARKKNPRYSMRAFAKKAGVSVGGLSGFLSGKISYSLEMLERFVNLVAKTPEERNEILEKYNLLVIDKIKRVSEKNNVECRILQDEEMGLTKEWYHLAILFLIKTVDFRFDVAWIAKRLKISSEEVESALSRLLELKLVTKNEDGTIALTSYFVKTTPNVDSEYLRFMHKQMLEMASRSVTSDSVDISDFSSLTLPVSLRNLPKAKEIIRKCQDDLINVLMDEDMSEVYQLVFSLYPVTTVVKEREAI